MKKLKVQPEKKILFEKILCMVVGHFKSNDAKSFYFT